MLVEVEEIEWLSQPPMIAALRLLDPFEVRVEVGLRVEGRAIDPSQLGVLLVAAPVRTGEPRQLDRLDRARVLQVGAAAEVGEVALRVEGDGSLCGADELDLVGLVLRLEPLARFLGGHLLARPLPALVELAPDLLLDSGQVLVADRLRELEVVVEAVLDRRTDRDLDARVEAADRLG